MVQRFDGVTCVSFTEHSTTGSSLPKARVGFYDALRLEGYMNWLEQVREYGRELRIIVGTGNWQDGRMIRGRN